MLRNKSFLNNRGVTLVEALVGGAMTAIVSLGVATMMQNSVQEQRKAQMLDTLRQRKGQLEALLRDQNVWNNTVTQNAANSVVPFPTLAGTSQSTSAIADASPVEFKLYGNSGSTVMYDLLGPDDSGGPFPGFTEKGGTCTEFYTSGNSNANDNCPFSYRALIGVSCATGSACMNPQLKIVYRLLFSPKANGTLSTMVNFINPVAGKDLSTNPGKYDVVVSRTATGVNRAFRIVAGFTPTADPGASGCGTATYDTASGTGNTCTVGTPAKHTMAVARGFADDGTNGGYDPFNLVTVGTNANAGMWQFAEPGYYGCLITAPVFSTGGFTLQLTNEGTGGSGNTPVSSAKISAGQWASATAVLDTKFNVQSTTEWYSVRQSCDAMPGGTPSANNCTLGLTSSYGAGRFFTSLAVSCYKLDKAMQS